METPELFKTEFIPALKESFSSKAGARASVFYEWKDESPVEVKFHAEPNSELECVFVQNLSSTARVPAQVKITASENATVKCTLVHQGGEAALIDLSSHCAGKGSAIHVQALSNAKGTQKHALKAQSRHSVPHTTSDLKVWCVADGNSQTIFNGVISIEHGAHHTEAFQKNKNLMLSEKAVVDSIPQLFISNDDVKCAHGSSTSTLEPEQYIYLQSRGIDRNQAEKMITRGFMENAVSWIENETTRTRVLKVLHLDQEEAYE